MSASPRKTLAVVMARELRFLLQTDTVIITNGAIPALLRLLKRITTSGRILCGSQWMRPDNLVMKIYTKYRKELGANLGMTPSNHINAFI